MKKEQSLSIPNVTLGDLWTSCSFCYVNRINIILKEWQLRDFLFPILPLSAAINLYKVLQILWIFASSIIKEEVRLEAIVFKQCFQIHMAMSKS